MRKTVLTRRDQERGEAQLGDVRIKGSLDEALVEGQKSRWILKLKKRGNNPQSPSEPISYTLPGER
jgi:hypothetical protein